MYDHNTMSVLWGNTAYCVNIEGLSRYSNEIESVVFNTKKESDVTVTNSRNLPHVYMAEKQLA